MGSYPTTREEWEAFMEQVNAHDLTGGQGGMDDMEMFTRLEVEIFAQIVRECPLSDRAALTFLYTMIIESGLRAGLNVITCVSIASLVAGEAGFFRVATPENG